MTNSIASLWPSERVEFADAATGRGIVRWTNSRVKDQHLYFTSPSVTHDDRWLVFLSDRTGSPNLFAVNRANGHIHQVSSNCNGLYRSYVFPAGREHGLSKVSPCLDSRHNRVFYIQDGQVWKAELDGPLHAQAIATLPEGWWTALNGISLDGRSLCIPCTDPRAFPAGQTTQWEQLDIVPQRMKAHNLGSRLLFFDTDTGKLIRETHVPFWVTHVQFDPAGRNRLILNQEGWTLNERPRVWALTEADELRPLSLESSNERASHEVWMPDGSSVVYHGWMENGDGFIESVDWSGHRQWRHVLPASFCGHLNILSAIKPARIVLDGRDGWLRICTVHDRHLEFSSLCEYGTRTWEDQDAHAHPAPTPQGRSIVFTNDRDGTCNVYEVTL